MPGIALRPLTMAAVERILSGERDNADWAIDYPNEGDIQVATWLHEGMGNHAPAESPWGPLQVIDLDSGLAIGGIGFHAEPDGTGTVEIGYGIAASHGGRGAATEAVARVIAIARRQGAQRIVAGTDPDNVPSQRVLQANGFVRTAAADEELRWSLDLLPGRTA